MSGHFYRERNSTFGQVMLKLRTSIDLKRAGQVGLLRVSRRAVGEWEGDLNSPKPEHLQHVLGLCVRASVFAPVRHAACREGQFFSRRKQWEERCHLMHADFSRPSEYTHTDWMQPALGTGSLARYKTLNSLPPHLFLGA